MKRVTASDARSDFFRLLDEVAAGEVVIIERNGRRVVLRREAGRAKDGAEDIPDYSRLLQAPKADGADRWTWEWKGPGEVLARAPRKKR